MIILLVGAEFLRADGRTDRQTDVTKIIVAFRIFANAPQKGRIFAFPWQQLLRECPKMYHCTYIACLFTNSAQSSEEKSGQGRPLFQGAMLSARIL